MPRLNNAKLAFNFPFVAFLVMTFAYSLQAKHLSRVCTVKNRVLQNEDAGEVNVASISFVFRGLHYNISGPD
jgi:hypothetical protein